MAQIVHLLGVDETATADSHFEKLAAFCGVNCIRISAERSPSTVTPDIADACLAASATALQVLFRSHRSYIEHILDNSAQVLIFGLTSETAPELANLLDVELGDFNSAAQEHVPITITGDRNFSSYLSGISFSTQLAPGNYGVFTAFDDTRATTLLRMGDLPVMLRSKFNQADIYLLAADCADINQPEKDDSFFYSSFLNIFPFIMFLRKTLGTSCWQVPAPLGSVVIDDPHLSRRHGFLDFAELDSMAKSHSNFGLSLAFIPFNHRRTRHKTATIFKAHSEKLSIAVHGCDHTRGEFNSTDEQYLSSKIATASKRMQQHQQRFGIPWDKVMVFPQGLFSRQALDQLSKHNYLAAVNSTLAEAGSSDGLARSDFLEIVCRAYNGVPLFGRVYPEQLSDMAITLFLGKPLIIVEHHKFFKTGMVALERVLNQVRELAPEIRWLPLGKMLQHTLQKRTTSTGSVQYRVFTDNAILPPDRSARELIIENRIRQVREVLVDNRQLPLNNQESTLIADLEQAGKESVLLSIRRDESDDISSSEKGYSYHPTEFSGIVTRRLLCDMRDNIIDRNKLLRWIVGRIRS